MSEKICRLCLQTIGNSNCQVIQETLVKTLKLNLKISKESVVCIKCANCLQVLYNFTQGCVYVGDGTSPLFDLEDGVKLDPVGIEATRSLIKTEGKCSFCTEAHSRQDLVSLKESKENKFLVNVLEQYIAEMNFKNAGELLTCRTCLGALQGSLSVILKCLEVEKKINEYIELKGTDDNGQIELKEVQQFILRPPRLETELVSVNELVNHIKEEYTATEEPEIKFEKGISPELIVKIENVDIKSEQNGCDGFQEPFVENKILNDPLPIPVVTSETRHLILKGSEIKMLKCELCSYEAKHKSTLKRHLVTHKSPLQIKMFKCDLCSYEAKRKAHLKVHLLSHKSPLEIKMYKCELCSYASKQKSNLKEHLFTHKSPLEMKMFKCELCPYEAKRKYELARHLLTHKSPSEMEMFKCELCPYEAKLKSAVIRHLLTHKSPSEIKMFKCDLCSYEAKRKSHLKVHSLTHQSPLEIETFRCELCSYEAKQKSNLKEHLFTHKCPLEIKMFKCTWCPYKAKRKYELARHLLTHKSEIEMFKCE